MKLNSKQQKTWDLIFGNPVSSKVQWKDVESLLISLALEIRQGNGSRIRAGKGKLSATFHQPHPSKEVDKKAIKSLRRFLKNVEVLYDQI